MMSEPCVNSDLGKPKRISMPHRIKEWAKHRGLRQADIVRELGADKGIVSKWFSGGDVSRKWQSPLAKLFGIEPQFLGLEPRLYELIVLAAARDDAELERIISVVKVLFGN
jgi:transcriptional regulator with XRE-family HTH domain